MARSTPRRFLIDFQNRIPTHVFLALFIALAASVAAAKNQPEKSKPVDSGTFVMMVNGQRVGAETFRIEQGPAASTDSSEFKSTTGAKAAQRAELQISNSGDLVRYDWHELNPGKAGLTVEPSGEFLLEHIVPGGSERPVDQPFNLSLSTLILDDYFFSQREILAWRYLAQACASSPHGAGGSTSAAAPAGATQCHAGPVQFGILEPRQRASLLATMEYAGTAGNQFRLNLKVSDDPEWVLFLDQNYKVMRISIASANTEIVRESP